MFCTSPGTPGLIGTELPAAAYRGIVRVSHAPDSGGKNHGRYNRSDPGFQERVWIFHQRTAGSWTSMAAR